jgi:hypothetical protein
MRTTSPDGSAGAPSAGGSGLGRLSSGLPAVAVGPTATSDTDLAETVPASARMSAITSTMRADTPHATPRLAAKKRPTVAIVVGVLVGAAVAVVIGIQMSGGGRSEPAATGSAPAPAPTAATNPTTTPEGTAAPGSAPVAANPAAEPKPGEAPGTAAEAAKPTEAVAPEGKAGEAKPAAEAIPAGSKPAEAKPAEPVAPVADVVAGGKLGRKSRLAARNKKGAPGNKGEAALEAAAATGDDTGAAAETGNFARIISLPSGAEVLIDGQSVGKTPFIGKDIDPSAPHALTVRKDGFENYEHMVSSSDWIKGKGNGQVLKVAVKLRKTRAAGEPEGTAGDKKAEKSGESAGESGGKTEPPPAETP